MFKEKYGTVSKASNTQVQLTDSLVKVNGSFRRTGTLTLNTSTGLDTGSITASTLYYLYVVIVGGIPVLRASLSEQKPTGFNSYIKIGAFCTDSSINVARVFSKGDILQVSSPVANANGSGGLFETSIWIANNNRTGAGAYNVTYAADRFINSPMIHITPAGSATARSYTVSVANNTGFSVLFSGGDTQFFVVLTRYGIDAAQPDWRDY